MIAPSILKELMVLKRRANFGWVLILSLISLLAHADQDGYGWLRIQQDRYSLIFPSELSSEAQRVANLMDRYLEQHLEELPVRGRYRPTPIVLFSEAHTSNGNVGLAPYRSHWFNKPAPLGATEWFDALAVHEGRHMVQFNQFSDHATGKVLYVLMGDIGLAAFSGLFVPGWYFEGDAVVSETVMTKGGRGRSAAFNLWLRTDWLSNSVYSYDRAMLGTDYDRTPFHSPYDLGYFLNQYYQETYDPQFMDRVLEKMGASLRTINFNGAVRSESGAGLSENYQRMVKQQSSQWQTHLDSLTLSEVTPVKTHSEKSKHWQSWYPISANQGQVKALEVDVKKGFHLVSIVDGKRTELMEIPKGVTRGYISSQKIKSAFDADGRFCFVEEVEHPTRKNNQFANLNCWSEEGKKQTLVSESKITNATYADGRFLVHEFMPDRTSRLRLLSNDGKTINKFDLPVRSFAYDMTASQAGWVFMLQTDDGHGVFHINEMLTDMTLLTAAQYENIRSPILTNNWLLYTSDVTGIDQVMARSRITHETFQIATRPFGSYFLTYDESAQTIVMADYTAKGQQLVSVEFSDPVEPPDHWVWKEAQTNDIETDLTNAVTAKSYPVHPYDHSKHLWNPHSWQFFLSETAISGGIQSTDIMHQLNIELNASVLLQESDWEGSAALNYQLENGLTIGFETERDWISDELVFDTQKLQFSRLHQYSQGLSSTNVLPTVAVGRLSAQDHSAIFVTEAAFAISHVKQSALQAIASPFSIGQLLQGSYVPETEGSTLYSLTQLGLKGLTERQVLRTQVEAQLLSGLSPTIMESSELFSGDGFDDLTVRGSLKYQIGLGGVGLPFTSALYWRSNSVEAEVVGQWQETLDYAVGGSFKPKVNVLRNAYLVAEPSLSIYYRPDTPTWEIIFRLGISN